MTDMAIHGRRRGNCGGYCLQAGNTDDSTGRAPYQYSSPIYYNFDLCIYALPADTRLIRRDMQL